ncbi:uncharacterized protein [Henckelia pumila]|uniref:uncharacterized protein n=1 Tax=Henckelia pumila TaxID=405737 RepID=UPI003C6E84E0
MKEYLSKLKDLLVRLENFEIKQIPRAENEIADQLAKFGSSATGINSRTITFITCDKKGIGTGSPNILCANQGEPSWKDEIIKYLSEGELPLEQDKARKLRVRAARFTLIDGELYKRGYSQPYLKCLAFAQADYVLREIHEGICGNHLGGKALAGKALRQGYFWPTMRKDALETFSPRSRQRKFLIVAVDYFTKWVEAEPLAKISEKKTRIGEAKGKWVDELPSVLWAYRTTPQSSIGESPFSLAYGVEAIAPAEIGEESLRIKHYNAEGNQQDLRASLDLIEELREGASVRAARHRARMSRAYDHRVKQRTFQVGDLVIRRADVLHPVGKLDPKWEGPYKVIKIAREGAYRLQHSNGKVLPRTWNVANLKKYFQ